MSNLTGWRTRLFAIFAIIMPNVLLLAADQIGLVDWTLWVDPKWANIVSVGAGIAVLILREMSKGAPAPILPKAP